MCAEMSTLHRLEKAFQAATWVPGKLWEAWQEDAQLSVCLADADEGFGFWLCICVRWVALVEQGWGLLLC